MQGCFSDVRHKESRRQLKETTSGSEERKKDVNISRTAARHHDEKHAN